MAIVATVQDLAEQQTEELANKFAGILKSVVPDVTKSLAKTAESFQKALLTGSDQKIQKAYGDLKGFLNTFDVNISDLGEGFRDTEKVFKSLTDQFEDTNEKIQGLREKNIFAEKELFVNNKNNNLEVRATILTDQQLFEKRKKLLAKEKELKDKDKNYLEQIRKVQSGDNVITEKQNANLLKDYQNNQDEIENTKKLKQLLSGKGGLAIGILDRFERSLEDNAPSFLVAAFAPIIDIARQFQKTFGLLVSGIKSTGKFIGKFLPDSFKKGFSKTMKSMTSFGESLKSGFKGLMKPLGLLKPMFTGLLGSFKKFGFALKTSIVAFLPMIAIAALVGLALYGLYKAFEKAVDFFKIKKDGPSESGLGGSQDTDSHGIGDENNVAKEGDMSSRIQRRGFHTKEGDGKSKFIKPDDPRYDKLYESKYGKPAPKKGSVYDPKTKTSKIMNLDDKGFVQNSSNFMDSENRTNIKTSEEMFSDKKEKVSTEKHVSKIMKGADLISEGLTGTSKDKFKKQDTIKRDLTGGSGGGGGSMTTLVNSQPSSSVTKVDTTNVLVPINTSSGDNYFDRQANNVHV